LKTTTSLTTLFVHSQHFINVTGGGQAPVINREIKMTGVNIVNAINQAKLVAFTHLHLNYISRQGQAGFAAIKIMS